MVHGVYYSQFKSNDIPMTHIDDRHQMNQQLVCTIQDLNFSCSHLDKKEWNPLKKLFLESSSFFFSEKRLHLLFFTSLINDNITVSIHIKHQVQVYIQKGPSSALSTGLAYIVQPPNFFFLNHIHIENTRNALMSTETYKQHQIFAQDRYYIRTSHLWQLLQTNQDVICQWGHLEVKEGN